MAFIKTNTSALSLSWDVIAKHTASHPDMQMLLSCIHSGFQENHRFDPAIKPYWQYRHALYELDGVILYDDRVVIPPNLRSSVLQTLHSAHQGVSSMEARARCTVFWPGMTADIHHIRDTCPDCIRHAPSQPRQPPAPPSIPSTPFESIASDFFQLSGHHYLVITDRLSGWPEVFKSPPGSPQSGAHGLISCLINYFACFGVPEELSSDGGPEFTASATEDFLKRWNIRHRLSSSYLPQSNGRAEVAVKSVKRLLRSNIDPSGSLNTEKFLKAMLQLRNTPDPDCRLSPAQIVFGQLLRDSLSFINRLEKFSNPNIRPMWREAWKEKESALRQRYHRTTESLSEHTRALPPLSVGDRCYVQNQAGNHPKLWDRSGTVVESPGHDSYIIKIDGSGRVTRRNRQFLRKFTPDSSFIVSPSPVRPDPVPAAEIPAYNSDHVQYTPAPEPAAGPPPRGNNTTTGLETSETAPPDSEPTPMTITSQSPPLAVEDSISTARPVRERRRPKLYEPESGQWITQ